MTAGQEKRELSGLYENDSMSIGAGVAVTFHMGSGSDDTTNRYLSLEDGLSYGIEMIPTVACSITKINGKALKAAISVGTGGIRMSTGKYIDITVQAGSATVVEVFAKE